jgi:undecaprenyl diphosphate synthase
MREPTTIGIIPDGNRRYAKKNNIPLVKAYWRGVKKAEEALEFLKRETNVKFAYFYTLSLENLRKRTKTELNTLFKILKKEIDRWLKTDPGVEVRFGGELEFLPKRIREGAEKLEEKTRGNEPKVGLMIGYSGIEEVLRAARLAKNPKSYEELRRYFYLPDFPDADLILRTSGEMRLSGFLPLQSAYAEFIFYPKLWPEMERTDFIAVLEEYAGRDRRFGR